MMMMMSQSAAVECVGRRKSRDGYPLGAKGEGRRAKPPNDTRVRRYAAFWPGGNL